MLVEGREKTADEGGTPTGYLVFGFYLVLYSGIVFGIAFSIVFGIAFGIIFSIIFSVFNSPKVLNLFMFLVLSIIYYF